MREALSSPADGFFYTHHLFAPTGVDLTLHTHTASLAWFAATALRTLEPVPAFNVLVIGSLFLNGIAARTGMAADTPQSSIYSRRRGVRRISIRDGASARTLEPGGCVGTATRCSVPPPHVAG